MAKDGLDRRLAAIESRLRALEATISPQAVFSLTDPEKSPQKAPGGSGKRALELFRAVYERERGATYVPTSYGRDLKLLKECLAGMTESQALRAMADFHQIPADEWIAKRGYDVRCFVDRLQGIRAQVHVESKKEKELRQFKPERVLRPAEEVFKEHNLEQAEKEKAGPEMIGSIIGEWRNGKR